MSEKKSESKKETKAPKGKKVTIEAELPLTDRAKVQRGELACQKLREAEELVFERKETSDRYAARIKTLNCEAKKLLEEFNTGKEKREVVAIEVRNFEKNSVEYHFKGKVVKTRDMTFADRQEEIPLKEKKGAPAAEPKAEQPASATAEKPKRSRGAKAGQVQKLDGDVASVIREETSARTKHSPVDGVRA